MKPQPQSNQDVREWDTPEGILEWFSRFFMPVTDLETGITSPGAGYEEAVKYVLPHLVDLIETAKAEARKEFAEEVKKLGIAYDYEKISQLLATLNSKEE